MQSRTLFFNRGVFGKTVSRFWPVWGGYFAVWLMMLPIVILSRREAFLRDPGNLRNLLMDLGFAGGMIMSAIFGLFSAMAVWSFAYNTRSANGMACLPVKREGVFVSVTLAGLLPYLAANVLITLLALLAQLAIGVTDGGATLQWFALATLPFLLFYGFAVFCAQLTGHILVLPAVYGVLNFVFVGGEVLVRALTSLFVYGMNQDMEAFTLKWLSPAVAIAMRCRVTSRTLRDTAAETVMIWEFRGWHILAIYAAVGVVLLALALLLYRRRRMETAGDVVAVEVLKPVFRWCMGIGAGLCLGALSYVLFWEYRSIGSYTERAMFLSVLAVMAVGAVIGWIIAEMLIRKSFRVFRGKWGGTVLCCAVLIAGMCAFEFDLFGYERYVPDADRVADVSINCGGTNAVLTSPEGVAQALALHRSITEHKNFHENSVDADGMNWAYVTLCYGLTGGRQVSREYRLCYPYDGQGNYGDVGDLQALLNCPEAIRSREALSVPVTENTICYTYISATMTAADCAKAAGYDSAEEYILREYCGLSGSEPEDLSPEDRAAMVQDAVETYADYDYEKYELIPRGSRDPAQAMFRYSWHFTDAQMLELYETCILPDLADGTLGISRIIRDDAYAAETYSTSIGFSLREPYKTEGAAAAPEQEGVEDAYLGDWFETGTTVRSARTNAWLEAHGVPQYTLLELEQQGSNP